MTTCTMPNCPYPPTTTNRAQQPTCREHVLARDAAPYRIIMLLPANRVEQAWWQDLVEPYRDRKGSPLTVEFLRGRMRFDRPDWTPGPKGDRPPFGCCLLIWSNAKAAS